MGGAAGQAGASGAGTGGGGASAVGPHKGSALVSGGVRAKSQNFTVVGTTGQSPGGNEVMKSPGRTFRGGVVGATQGK